MQVTIEFFRIREAGDAQALVGREPAEAADLTDAIGMGRRLGLMLHMPQRPDAMAIMDRDGTVLYTGALHIPIERSRPGEVTATSPVRENRRAGRPPVFAVVDSR